MEIVVSSHLACLAMAAKLNSQVARLRDLDVSDGDGEEPAESEGSTDSDDEPQFFVRPLFASGGGGHKERVRDYCTKMIAKTMAGPGNDPVQVYRTGSANHREFLRLWTGFGLSSSWSALPCYGADLNRNILDFMRWSDFGLVAQDLNDIQRPKSFQKNSWK
jgi:hypothetical protein